MSDAPIPSTPTLPPITLPVDTTAAQPLVAPSPHVPTPATTGAPVVAEPTLPTLPSVHAVTAPAPVAPDPSAPASQPFTQPSQHGVDSGNTPPRQPATMSTGRRLLAALGLAGLVGAAGYLVYDDYIAAPDPAATSAPNASPAADGAPGVGQIVEVIDESTEVVAVINDNSQEAELLGELGLDATGAPVAQAYTFRWLDVPSSDDTITVDLSTGDFEVVNVGGRLRRVDGVFYTQNPVDGTWSQTGDLDVERAGMSGLITTSDVLPEPIKPFVVATEELADGSTRVVVQRRRLADEAPELLAAWLGPWGLIDGEAMAGVEPASDVVDVVMSADADGLVQRVTISTSVPLGQVQYEMMTTSAQAVAIDAPVTQD